MLELSRFENLINKLAYEKSINEIFPPEDIKQELYMKLLQELPTCDNLSENEIFNLMKVCLRNHRIDIERKQIVRKDTSEFSGSLNWNNPDSEEGGSLIDLYDGNDPEFQQTKALPSQISLLQQEELLEIIMDWASWEDEYTQTFIKEALSPSEEIYQEWKSKSNPRAPYSNSTQTPRAVLEKHLNFPQGKISRILDKLRDYLGSLGYEIKEVKSKKIRKYHWYLV